MTKEMELQEAARREALKFIGQYLAERKDERSMQSQIRFGLHETATLMAEFAADRERSARIEGMEVCTNILAAHEAKAFYTAELLDGAAKFISRIESEIRALISQEQAKEE